jgi:trans-2,3-dihydro-3-hydroxyanthranilate isomerase
MGIPFYQVDVFTDHIFGGNPLAVFTEGQKLKEEDLQKIAREMNLSETSFVYPSTKNEADFDVRIFTPTREIPFAGHPTLGSAYVLRKYGATTENPLRLNFKAGVIPVSTEGDRIFMQHPPAQILHELIPSKIIAEALGIPLSSLDGKLPIKVVTTGFPALFVPVNSLSIINRIVINIQTLNKVLGPLGIDMIYPFCRETLNPENTVHSRAFAPGLGILEDPATGSVAGAMGAYWASLSNEVHISMVIEQGYAMQRPSLIHVQVSNREIQKIRVGGQCQSVFTGLIDLEGKI